MLSVGDKAPDFELPTGQGQKVRLSEAIAKGPVVLLSFPFAFSRG